LRPPKRLSAEGLYLIGLSPLSKPTTVRLNADADRLLVIEALRLAASHWNATTRAVAEKDWRQQATGGIAARFEQRAIEALRLAAEIEGG
jgi:hypothetical protein